MSTVIKVVIIGAIILVILSLIPPLMIPVAEVIDAGFSSEITAAMNTVYGLLPVALRQMITALFAAVVIGIIIRWTIGDK